ncbi:MAG: ATP-binding protein [Clostridiales bacterium]|nr:ATP-binding protein [Clostridiales bacterium]
MASEIIGRTNEWHRLDMCLENDEAQLIAVYGRRRVGKTFLINNYFKGRFDFKITGVYKQPLKEELSVFIAELNNQTGQDHPVPADWMEAFGLLRDYIESKPENEKVVVFFDEMPWLDTPRSKFLAAFEWFWNGWGSARKNLVFIVCGSATSWMKKNLDENKGGLYNRLTCRIYLMPFTLGETEEYLISRGIRWSRYDITECYMIMGGIPYYLSKIDSELTYGNNIDNLFFRKRAELWDEFTFLYRTLFENSDQYVKVVEALSTKRNGLSRGEIAEKTELPENGVLTEMLNNLEYSGFIRINDFYGKKQKTYQLSDYYTMFYLRFIKGNYGRDEHFWSNMLDNPARKAWAGFTFEQVCKDHVDKIKSKIGISGVLSSVSVWRRVGNEETSGAEIDMLIERRDRVVSICEIKFSTGEYEINKEYEMKLRNKIGAFGQAVKSGYGLQLVMITTFGVKKNIHSGIVSNQVTIDDLF